MYTYSWYQWLAFFYIYCIVGWIFESTYVSVKTKHPVNRGFLRIPMLPLYGSGAVMMLWISLPFRFNLALVYLSGVIGATVLEYITGSVMEQLFKIRYWDYSSQKFQIRGYICLSSSVAWGFLTILMTEVIHEPIAGVVLSLNQNVVIFSVVLVTAVFAADVYESTKAALALGKSLEAMTKLKADMEELQTRILTMKEEAAEQVHIVREETAERLTAARAETMVKLASIREDTSGKVTAAAKYRTEEFSRLKQQLEEMKAKRQALFARGGLHRFYREALLKGNPGAASSKFTAALKELQEEIEKRGHDFFEQ